MTNRLLASLCLAIFFSFSTAATAQTVVALTPIADTYTQQGTPDTNYGTQTTVLVRQDSAGTLNRGGYFEFDLSTLPAGTITSAQLRVFGSHDTGGAGIAIEALGGTTTATWGETALTYNNSLTLTGADFAGTPLATTNVAPPPSTTYSWDVTSFIVSRRSVGNATIALGQVVADTYRATFNSKEATSNRPQLVVTIATPTTVNLTPIADTYTQQGTPDTNYGTATTVLVRQDSAGTLNRGGYFEFDLSTLPAGTITSAQLRLFGSHDTGGAGIAIEAFGGTTTATWSETALTYTNSLTLTGADFAGTPLTTTNVAPPPSTTYSWDVTSFIASRRSAGNATIALGQAVADTYRATFNSKEATSNRPQLAVTINVTDATPPSSPGAISFSNVTATSATVNWGAATDNVAVTGYDYRVNSGSWVSLGNVLTVALTGLTSSTNYTINVRARDAAGNVSATPGANSFTTSDVTLPSSPGAITFSNVTTNSATVNWSAATDNIGVAGYDYRINGGSWVSLGNVLTVALTGLSPSTNYTVDVRARDAAGNLSATPSTNSFTTLDATPPSSPGAISFSNIAATSATVNWGAATDNVAVTGYDYRVNGGSWVSLGNVLTVALTGLTSSTNYTVNVRARDAAGNVSATPSANSFTTLDTTPPSSPGAIGFSNIAATSATVNWGAATDNVAVTGYDYRVNGGSWVSLGNVLTTSLTGLTSSTNYTINVRARDAAGNVSTTPSANSFTTLDGTPPSSPGAIGFSNITTTSATVSWGAATDNVAVTGYDYRVNGGSWVSLGNVLTTSLTGLTPSTNYTINVRARDAAGNVSAMPSADSFTTLDPPDTTPPSSPGAVSFTNVASTSATANWGAATDNVEVTEYEYRINSGSWINIGNVLSVAVAGLTPSTNYTLSVRARDAAGNVSATPASNSFTTSAAVDITPPSQPGAVSFSAITASSATVNWGAATDNVGVTGYDYRVNAGSWTSLGNVLTVGLSSLAASTNYTVDVRARDLAGNISALASNSFTTAATAGWTPACPNNYVPAPGENINYPTPSGNRSFSLNLPSSTSTPRPVWVPLTGSVESTTENLDARGGNRALTQFGYIVIGPVRKCAGSGAGSVSAAGTSVSGGTCNQAGTGGWNWNPWNEGRVFGTAGDPWKTDEGPDSLFLESVVKCVATRYPVDQSRVFVGGISSGGTMTNRALVFNSDFWAGGMPISGEWYVSQDNGTAYPGSDEFLARRAAVAADPYRIFQGRVGPYPLKGTLTDTTSLSPMIVITVWGGDTDLWNCGSTLCADYRPTTQAASNYYSSFSNVLHIACSSSHGHQWPTINRDAFNQWALATLSSHPKGTPKAAFGNKLITNPPPSGYSCVLGPYADHYAGAPPPSAGAMNWGMFGHDYNNSRSSPDTTIDASNASSLHVVSRVTGGGITSTPTIVDDVAYVSDFRGHVKAIRITDNVVLWDVMPSASVTMLSPSPYVTKDTIYVGGNLGWVFALNRANGALRWSRQIETTPNARVSSSPIVVGNTLIVGSGSYQVFIPATPMFRGKVVYLDATTGAVLSYATNMCPTGTCGGGISVWSTAAIDPQTRTGYIGTGQAYAAPAGPYSDALVAFNLDTGAIRWSYQFTANDVYTINTGTVDHDVGAAPNLFTAVVGGVTRQLVGVGDKGGRYAAFDRTTGQQIWLTTIGDASAIGGMMHSAAYSNNAVFVVNNQGTTVGHTRNDPVPSTGVARRLNAATGAIEWTLNLPAGGFGGVTVANGLVYFMTWNGLLYAVNANTGEIVKTVQASPAPGVYVAAPTDGFPNGSASGPMVYNGKVYVGYGWTWVLNIDGGLAAIGL